MHDKIFSIIMDGDEITWQSIIHDLINSGQVDPYDVDISQMTKQYIETIKTLKKHDFRISGKVLLAAAILLKIKSNRLVGEDILNFDKLLEDPEEETQQDLFGEEIPLPSREHMGRVDLIPRTPQPRKRKVSIYDLMNALDKALEVKRRRVLQSMPPPIVTPAKTRDLTKLIKNLYAQVYGMAGKGKIMFSDLVPSPEKVDKIYTFIPLLHLTNQKKVKLFQQTHFGDFEVRLRKADS